MGRTPPGWLHHSAEFASGAWPNRRIPAQARGLADACRPDASIFPFPNALAAE
jgi:hypothetical protein